MQGKALYNIILKRGDFLLIEMIDDRHLKVELDNYDMSLMNIKRGSFALRDENAGRVLKIILRNAYEQTGFDIFHTKLTVEVFPTIDNGCLILFTRNNAKRFKAETIKKRNVYRFSDINSLLDCLNALYGSKNAPFGSIYEFNGKYYLCLSKNFKICKAALLVFSEFSAVPDKISPLFLSEHGTLICKKIANYS